MEDAYVMAQVLQDMLNRYVDGKHSETARIEAAFVGYQTTRRPRFEKVLDTSAEAMGLWSDLWRPELTEADFERWKEDAYDRMGWIWDARLKEQGEKAQAIARGALGASCTVNDESSDERRRSLKT